MCLIQTIYKTLKQKGVSRWDSTFGNYVENLNVATELLFLKKLLPNLGSPYQTILTVFISGTLRDLV